MSEPSPNLVEDDSVSSQCIHPAEAPHRAPFHQSRTHLERENQATGSAAFDSEHLSTPRGDCVCRRMASGGDKKVGEKLNDLGERFSR
jgi:hypothetical protein